MKDLEFRDYIESKYILMSNFSEGLAKVQDINGIYHFIDKNGEKKITIPHTFCSEIKVGDRVIKIEANDKLELAQKKLKVVEEIRNILISEANNVADNLFNIVSSEVKQYTK